MGLDLFQQTGGFEDFDDLPACFITVEALERPGVFVHRRVGVHHRDDRQVVA